jgi:glycogen phosphorylase
VHTTLARAAYNLDVLGAYQATALSVRDRLISRWNKTQIHHTQMKPKRVYYFSLEFLMGKSLDNALLNLGKGVRAGYEGATEGLGFNMEDLVSRLLSHVLKEAELT